MTPDREIPTTEELVERAQRLILAHQKGPAAFHEAFDKEFPTENPLPSNDEATKK